MSGNSIYIDSFGTATSGTGYGFIRIEDAVNVSNYGSGTAGVYGGKGIHPQLYFKYVKSKFNLIENRKIAKRVKLLEKAFDAAVENGQNALADKFVREVVVGTRETLMFAKGIKEYIERDDLWKHKRAIRGGHISDTKFEDFTRAIPDRVLKRKKEVNDLFDGFVIFHYWNEEEQKKAEKKQKQKMSSEEKAKMRDPVLFGVIKENDRLYFIDEWDDEFCDLTFDEMAGIVAKRKGRVSVGTIEELPTLN